MTRLIDRLLQSYTRGPVETERINMLNELVLRRVKRVSADDIVRVAREWKGEPPVVIEIAEHFMHSIADKEGLPREGIHHTTKTVAKTYFAKALERLKDDGKLRAEEFGRYRAKWVRGGQVPCVVYIHPERHGKDGWIPHAEWKRPTAQRKA